ncbi:MAG: indolepyruvate oxidoreductase subunit beta [Coriobacteriales bacterium]
MNAVIAGVGGQGTVLASRLVAYMGMRAGLPVRTAETIGMAQRGGCVTSHVRIGDAPDDQIASPLVAVGGADVVCAFEPGEGTRALRYLAPHGVMVLATRAVVPVTASLGGAVYDPAAHIDYLSEALGSRLVRIDPAEVVEQLGSDRPVNVVLLGAASASQALNFTLDALKDAIAALVKPSYVELNCAAAELGARAYEHQSTRW